ncbi:reverse transcriptase [Plakobranchus ocellatus]|uniref:Reverse transcriptase n=1 Tax=Plakobranchus ocellatus TaxID=259542 RepID=A0AAV3XU41_9GAST|nr:reverse transcriptase [Plakobranchus ocellatus]
MPYMPRQGDHRTCFQFLQSISKPGQVHVTRHNRVLQELAIATCGAKGMPVQTKARALVFTSEGGTKSWRGSAVSMDTQRKSLQDGCDDYEFSADLYKVNQDTKRGMTSYFIQVLLNKSSYRTHSTI